VSESETRGTGQLNKFYLQSNDNSVRLEIPEEELLNA
jgi:hypothetical protein